MQLTPQARQAAVRGTAPRREPIKNQNQTPNQVRGQRAGQVLGGLGGLLSGIIGAKAPRANPAAIQALMNARQQFQNPARIDPNTFQPPQRQPANPNTQGGWTGPWGKPDYFPDPVYPDQQSGNDPGRYSPQTPPGNYWDPNSPDYNPMWNWQDPGMGSYSTGVGGY